MLDDKYIAVWPDGTHCNMEDLEEYLTFISDDFRLINVDEVDDKTLQSIIG